MLDPLPATDELRSILIEGLFSSRELMHRLIVLLLKSKLSTHVERLRLYRASIVR